MASSLTSISASFPPEGTVLTQFTRVNPESDLSLTHVETDTSAWIQFFDLRIADVVERANPVQVRDESLEPQRHHVQDLAVREGTELSRAPLERRVAVELPVGDMDEAPAHDEGRDQERISENWMEPHAHDVQIGAAVVLLERTAARRWSNPCRTHTGR